MLQAAVLSPVQSSVQSEVVAADIDGDGWAASDANPDPDVWISGPFHSRNAGPSNRVWLKDDQVDALAWIGQMMNSVSYHVPEKKKLESWRDRLNTLGRHGNGTQHPAMAA